MLARQPLRAFIGLAVSVMLLSACNKPDAAATAVTDANAPATETATDVAIKSDLVQEIPKPSEYMVTEGLPPNAPTYLVGTMGSYAPMSFRDEYGQSIGFDMDIMYAIAARQKFHISVLTHPWTGMLNTLNTGERDIIISSVNITPERSEVYQFSQPYFSLKDVALVKSKHENIQKFEDLITTGSKVAALTSSAQHAQALAAGIKPENVVLSETQFLALKDLFSDRVTASIGDGPVMEYYALSYPEIPTRALTLPDAETEYFGIVVKKGNAELRDKINTGLKQIYEEGVYDRIYFKWFHKPVPKDFLPWTTG